MNKPGKLLFPLLLVFLLACPAWSGNKLTSSPEKVELVMAVTQISGLEMATGKYNANFTVFLKYPDVALPHAISYESFKKDVEARLTPERNREILKYYLLDRDEFVYYLKPGLIREEKLAAYRLLKASDYFEKHFPFDLVNGKISQDPYTGDYKVTRYELDPVNHNQLVYDVEARVDTDLDFRDYPMDSQDLSIILSVAELQLDLQFVPNRDIVVIPEFFRYDFFLQAVRPKLKGENLALIMKYYRPNRDKSYYTIQNKIQPNERRRIKRILDSVKVNTQLPPDLALPGWDLQDGEIKFGDIPYLGMSIASAVFPITIVRNHYTSFMKVVVPLIFMIIISLLALFIGIEDVTNRLTLVTGTLLAAVMFHLSATSALPPVGYLTLVDKLFLCGYASFVLNLIFTVILLHCRENKKTHLLQRYYRMAFWVVLPLTALFYTLALLI